MKLTSKIKANKRWLVPVLSAAGGAIIGLVIYLVSNCSTGSCPITSSLPLSMLYMAFVGFIFSNILTGGCACGCGGGSCNISNKDK